jgi:hypothetical protein
MTRRSVGVLKVISPRPSAFNHWELEILKLMADLLAASMYFAARCGNDALFHRATHDMLTGLANRALFLDRLRNALLQADREKKPDRRADGGYGRAEAASTISTGPPGRRHGDPGVCPAPRQRRPAFRHRGTAGG